MSLDYAVPGLEGLAEAPAKPAPLNPALRQALESLGSGEPRPVPQKRPRAFSQDLDAEPAAGEEQTLKAIVQGYFLGGDWENSRIELERYLSLHHTAGIAARARYYLAQTLYFSLSYREALREFLLVKDFFPQEANEWISASLAALAE
jgi:TolA-binding protein